jgi:hypothetical protein
VDINMAKLCLNLISVTFDKAYSLSIVAPESLFDVKGKANITAEAVLSTAIQHQQLREHTALLQ